MTVQEGDDGGAVCGVLVALTEDQVGVGNDGVAGGRVGQHRGPVLRNRACGGGGRWRSVGQCSLHVADGWQQVVDASDLGVVGGIHVFRAYIADGVFGAVHRGHDIAAQGNTLERGRLCTDLSGGEGAADAELGRALAVQVTGEDLGGAAAAAAVEHLDGLVRVAGVDLVPIADRTGEDPAQLGAGQVQVVDGSAVGQLEVVRDGDRGGCRRNLDQRAPLVGDVVAGAVVVQVVGVDFRIGKDRVAACEIDGHTGGLVDIGGTVEQESRLAFTAANTGVGVETGAQYAWGGVQALWQGWHRHRQPLPSIEPKPVRQQPARLRS